MQVTVSHFVYSRFVLRSVDGKEEDSGFLPVAATPDLNPEELREIRTLVSVGKNEDLDQLNAFLVSGLLSNGYRVLAHFMRSPSRAVGRSHYAFVHFVLMDRKQWQIMSHDMSAILSTGWSSNIYRVYRHNSLEPIRLEPLTFDIHLLTRDILLANLEAFISENMNAFYAVIEGVLEHDSVTIVNFPEDLKIKANLLQAIHTVLPPTLVEELTFATQVFQKPETCYTRIKFLAHNRSLSDEYLSNYYVTDWLSPKTIKDNGTYTFVLSEAISGLDKDIGEVIDLISTIELPKLSEISEHKGTEDFWILNSKSLQISRSLAVSLKRKLGLSFITKNISSSSIFDIYDTLVSLDQEISNLNLEIYQDLVVRMIVGSFGEGNDIQNKIATYFCNHTTILDTTSFWGNLNRSLDQLSKHEAYNFFQICWQNPNFRCLSEPANIFKQVILAYFENLSKLSPQDAVSLLAFWTDNKLLTQDEFAYHSPLTLKYSQNLSTLAVIIEQSPCEDPTILYQNLIRNQDSNNLLSNHPNIASIIYSLSGRLIDKPSMDYLWDITDLSEDRALYLSLARDALILSRYNLLNVQFFKMFLDYNLTGRLAGIIKENPQGDLIRNINSYSRGAYMYLVWRNIITSSVSLTHQNIVAYQEADVERENFVDGFIALASQELKLRTAIVPLQESFRGDLLRLIVALLQRTETISTTDDLIQVAVSVCNSFALKEKVDDGTIITLLTLITSQTNSKNIVQSLLPIALRDPLFSLVDASQSGSASAVLRLNNIIQALIKAGVGEESIVHQLFRGYTEKTEDHLVAIGLMSLVGQWSKTDTLPRHIATYVFSLSSDIVNKMPLYVVEFYKNILTSSSANTSDHHINYDFARMLLIRGEINRFIVECKELPESEVLQIIYSNWHPRTIDDINMLITRIENFELLQSVRELIFSGEIDVSQDVMIDFVTQTIRVLSTLMRPLTFIDVNKLPSNFTQNQKVELAAYVEDLEMYMFSTATPPADQPSRVSIGALIGLLRSRLNNDKVVDNNRSWTERIKNIWRRPS